MNIHPVTHAVSKLLIECSTCVPSGLREPHAGMPYTLSFVTGANSRPSVFQDVRDTGQWTAATEPAGRLGGVCRDVGLFYLVCFARILTSLRH